jgi:hypothetical protein
MCEPRGGDCRHSCRHVIDRVLLESSGKGFKKMRIWQVHTSECARCIETQWNRRCAEPAEGAVARDSETFHELTADSDQV